MNDETNKRIDTILGNYLKVLEDGQTDILAAYKTGEPVTYMKAIERHERTARGVKDAAEGLYTLIAIGENVEEAAK